MYVSSQVIFHKDKKQSRSSFFCRALALNKSSTLIQLTGLFTLQKKFLSNKSDHHFQSCNMNACPPLVQILLSELSPLADQGKCRHTVLCYRTHCYDWTSTATTFSPLLILSAYCFYLIDNIQYVLVREDLLYSATNFLYERKYAKIQAGYKRIFCKNASVIR